MNLESNLLRLTIGLVRFIVLFIVYGVVALIGAGLLISLGGLVYKNVGPVGLVVIGFFLWFIFSRRRQRVSDKRENVIRDMQEFRDIWVLALQEARGKSYERQVREAYFCTETADNRLIAKGFYTLLMRWSRGTGLEAAFKLQWRTTLQRYVRGEKPVFTAACLIDLSRLMVSAAVLVSRVYQQETSQERTYRNTSQNAGWNSYQRSAWSNGQGRSQRGSEQQRNSWNGQNNGTRGQRASSGSGNQSGFNSRTGGQNRNRRTSTRQSKAWYVVLGVSEEASIDVIKKAYRRKIVENHPDRVAHLGEKKRQDAEEISKEINEAFQYVKKYKGF